MRQWASEDDGSDRPVRAVVRPADWVGVTLYVRRATPSGKAWLVWDGITRETVEDKRYGGTLEREKWVMLPKSRVRRLDPALPGKPETVDMPLWLARQRGLV